MVEAGNSGGLTLGWAGFSPITMATAPPGTGKSEKFVTSGHLPVCYLFDRHFIWVLQFSSVQSLSCVQLFATPWTAACQASLSITNSQSLPKLMSIELVMPSNHLILCHPFFLSPSTFPRVFSNESVLCIRWPKYRNFSFSIRIEHWTFQCSFQWTFRIDVL